MKILEMTKRLAKDESGASMVEYAIGVGFIAAILVVAVALFSNKLGAAFDAVGANLE